MNFIDNLQNKVEGWLRKNYPFRHILLIIFFLFCFPTIFWVQYKYREIYITPEFEKYEYVLRTRFFKGCEIYIPKGMMVNGIEFYQGWQDCALYDGIVKEGKASVKGGFNIID